METYIELVCKSCDCFHFIIEEFNINFVTGDVILKARCQHCKGLTEVCYKLVSKSMATKPKRRKV